MNHSALLRALLILFVLVCGIYDLRSRRIPNWLTMSGLTLGIVANCYFSKTDGLLHSFYGLGLALLIYFPLWLFAGLGAGDVKAMVAIGAIVGPQQWLYVFLCTCIAGGIVAVGVSFAKRRLQETTTKAYFLLIGLLTLRSFRNLHLARGNTTRAESLKVPYAVSIALGSIAALSLGAIR